LELIHVARLAVPQDRSLTEFDTLYQDTILSSSLLAESDNKKEEESIVPSPVVVTPSTKKEKRGRKKDQKIEELEEIESVAAAEENQSEDADESGRKKRAGKGLRGKRSFFGDEENASASVEEPKSNRKRSRGPIEEVVAPVSGKKKPRHSKGVEVVAEDKNPSFDETATDEPKQEESIAPLYFDMTNPQTQCFPPAIAKLIDLWIRWLLLFLRRIDEIDLWKRHSCLILASSLAMSRKGIGAGGANGVGATKVTKKMSTRDHQASASSSLTCKDWNTIVLKPDDSEQAVIRILDWAKQRNLCCSVRRLIERRYQNSLEWQQKVESILREKSCRLSLEETQVVLKESDESLLFVYPDLIHSLKDQIKRAKAWIHKLEKPATDGNGGSTGALVPITTKELEEILPETENICIDLTSHISNILQHTKVYCLCREASHGMMLGCDKCEDWCHISCIGLTKTQVR
jgi:hypothetical protein